MKRTTNTTWIAIRFEGEIQIHMLPGDGSDLQLEWWPREGLPEKQPIVTKTAIFGHTWWVGDDGMVYHYYFDGCDYSLKGWDHRLPFVSGVVLYHVAFFTSEDEARARAEEVLAAFEQEDFRAHCERASDAELDHATNARVLAVVSGAETDDELRNALSTSMSS